jgi:hypothetical protein
LTAGQYFCYPETTNLTLEEIDWLFYEGKVVRRSRKIAKEGWGDVEGLSSPPAMESGSEKGVTTVHKD